MKKIFLLMMLASVHQMASSQNLNKLLNKADHLLNNKNNTQGSNNPNGLLGANLSNTEIVNGLKEALNIGTKNASGKLNKANGFFGNQLIKIMLPPEVRNIEKTLRSFGFNAVCDKLILSLNRAAEDASGKAVPIFMNAITSMSIVDGLNILRGGNNAATEFLKRNTTGALTTAFRPVIESSLSKVNATFYWKEVFNTYNKLPISRTKVNPDLTGYVTERALNGLFVTVADEEANIRKNPAAQVSNLLKKVFGGK
jgi:hypothetical protein